MDVKEGLVPDAERLFGLVNLSIFHLFHPGGYYFLLYAQQSDVEVTLADRLPLENMATNDVVKAPKRTLNHLRPLSSTQ